MVVAVPGERVAGAFCTLRPGVAGDVAQRFVHHRFRLVIVGGIAPSRLADSDALRDFVREADRGGRARLVTDRSELGQRPATA